MTEPPTTDVLDGVVDQFDQATIYLAEADVVEFEELIRTAANDERAPRRVPIRPGVGVDGALFVADYDVADPGWKRSLVSFVGDPLAEVGTRQAGAVLLLRLAGRIFALTFGQGRHLLDRDRLVDDFGVRVAANTVDPRFIRSVDGRSFERGVILTRRQASRPDRVEALGLQVDRELFSAITGRSRRADDGRIHGGTSLGLSREMPFASLDALASELVEAYTAEDYKAAFPTLDRLRPLARTDLMVGRLTERLVRDIRSPEPTAYLAPPTMLDWEDVSGFRFSTIRGRHFDEPALADYLDSLDGPPTEGNLAADEVRVVARDSPRITSRSPVLHWFVFETTLDDDAFVLSAGRWYRVSHEYIAFVDATVARLAPPTVVLPPPTHAMEEDEYNREAARTVGGVLLDRQLARVATERGGFELCDIFVPPNHLVHVKRGLGSQALTYLFSQGIQAAEGLRYAREVRERLVTLVRASNPAAAATLPIDRRPERGALRIVYGVVTRSPERVPGQLPFFARATLARAVRTLDELDFDVSISGVRAP